MDRLLTREEAQAFQERWRIVNEREREELRQMTVEQKMRQLDVLFQFADSMGWRPALAEDDWREHELWNELRKKLNDRDVATLEMATGDGDGEGDRP